MDKEIGVLGYIAYVVGLFVFAPIVVFWCGYFGGLILKWLVGDFLTNGLNLLFDTTRFSSNVIPLVCASLATVGSYFKSVQNNNK